MGFHRRAKRRFDEYYAHSNRLLGYYVLSLMGLPALLMKTIEVLGYPEYAQSGLYLFPVLLTSGFPFIWAIRRWLTRRHNLRCVKCDQPLHKPVGRRTYSEYYTDDGVPKWCLYCFTPIKEALRW